MDKILCIMGPTSVGKTAVSIMLAKKLNTEIISADSMQIYCGLDIGTAKISRCEMCGIKHHFIDYILPNQSFSSYEYGQEATKIIEKLLKEGKPPLIVGGTAFYFDAFLYPLAYSEDNKEEIRNSLKTQLAKYGGNYLYQKLKEVDPQSAEKIHPNNTVRVMRALEILQTTGRKKSDFALPALPKYDAKIIVLDFPREKLYERINSRVEQMFEKGLIDEVSLLIKKYSKDSQCFSAIGYKEIIEYLDGKSTIEEAKEQIKQNTRNYAKRQISYFKRFKEAIWLNCDNVSPEEISNNIMGLFLYEQHAN